MSTFKEIYSYLLENTRLLGEPECIDLTNVILASNGGKTIYLRCEVEWAWNFEQTEVEVQYCNYK